MLQLLFFILFSAHSSPESLPRFDDFPVASTQIDTGLSIGIRFPQAISTGTRKELHKTKEKLNSDFAGHYIIAGGYILCGTGCVTIVIVNAHNGKTYEVPFSIGSNALREDEPRVEYELNSNLLIIRGTRNEKGLGTYYYQWKNNRLNPIRTIEGKIIPTTLTDTNRI